MTDDTEEPRRRAWERAAAAGTAMRSRRFPQGRPHDPTAALIVLALLSFALAVTAQRMQAQR